MNVGVMQLQALKEGICSYYALVTMDVTQFSALTVPASWLTMDIIRCVKATEVSVVGLATR